MSDHDDVKLTPLQQQGMLMHEIFESLTDAGFTAEQAIYLTSAVICGGPRVPGGE